MVNPTDIKMHTIKIFEKCAKYSNVNMYEQCIEYRAKELCYANMCDSTCFKISPWMRKNTRRVQQVYVSKF